MNTIKPIYTNNGVLLVADVIYLLRSGLVDTRKATCYGRPVLQERLLTGSRKFDWYVHTQYVI